MTSTVEQHVPFPVNSIDDLLHTILIGDIHSDGFHLNVVLAFGDLSSRFTESCSSAADQKQSLDSSFGIGDSGFAAQPRSLGIGVQ